MCEPAGIGSGPAGANPGNSGMGAGRGAAVPGNVGGVGPVGNGHGGVTGSPGGTSGGAQAAAGPGGPGSGHHGIGPGGLSGGGGTPAGGLASASGTGGVAPGSANQGNKGDRGGASIGSRGGPPSADGVGRGGGSGLGSIGLAVADALAGMVSEMANRPGSTHAMNSPSSQGFAPPGQTAMQDAIAAARGPGARGRAEAAALGDPRGQSPSGVRGGVPSDINSRAGMNSADYMGLLPDATQASLGGWPAGTAANRDRMDDFAGVRGHATAQDPGPRGQPAPPGLPDFAGPRHSSPTPSPVSQDSGFNASTDVGPIADMAMEGLSRARDAFRGMESRAGFQRGRVGGVGGGGTGQPTRALPGPASRGR